MQNPESSALDVFPGTVQAVFATAEFFNAKGSIEAEIIDVTDGNYSGYTISLVRALETSYMIRGGIEFDDGSTHSWDDVLDLATTISGTDSDGVIDILALGDT